MSFRFFNAPLRGAALPGKWTRPLVSTRPVALRSAGQVRHLAIRRAAPETGPQNAMAGGLSGLGKMLRTADPRTTTPVDAGGDTSVPVSSSSSDPFAIDFGPDVDIDLDTSAFETLPEIESREAPPAEEKSSIDWSGALKSLTSGAVNLFSQYQAYDAAKDDNKARQRDAQNAALLTEKEQLLAREQQREANYAKQLLLQKNQSTPTWVMPAVIGGVALVGVIAFMGMKK